MKNRTKIKFNRRSRHQYKTRVRMFSDLLDQNEQLFLREWNKLVVGWVSEIHRRRKNWQESADFRNEKNHDGVIETGRTRIFGVIKLAEMYLEACGEKAEKLVGEATRQVLTNECSKAVAIVVDGRLNGNLTHHWYRWI